MVEFQTNEQYRLKKQEVIDRFKKEFMETYYKEYDPTFRHVLELLIRDADPYEIIERLIKDRKELADKFKEFVTLYSRPLPFYYTEY